MRRITVILLFIPWMLMPHEIIKRQKENDQKQFIQKKESNDQSTNQKTKAIQPKAYDSLQ